MWNIHSPMNRVAISALWLVLVGACSLYAQETVSNGQFKLSDWQSFTSMANVRAVTADAQNRIWAATSGGVFNVNPATRQTTEFRNIDALYSLDATAIAYDASGNTIYAGTYEGVLEIYNLDTAKWVHILDITNAAQQYSARSINDIVFRGNVAYIATDFGVLLFDTKNRVFIETVDRVGSFQQKSKIAKIVLSSDSIYVAGTYGVAVAPLNAKTLREPEVWKTLLPQTSPKPPNVVSLLQTPSGLYAIADTLLYRRMPDSDSLEIIQHIPASYQRFKSLAFDGTNLFYATQDMIALVKGSALQLKHPSAIQGYSFLQMEKGIAAVAYYETAGIGLISTDTLPSMITLNTPLSNRLQDITVDTSGNVWFATATSGSDGQGFSCLQNGRWFNYSSSTTPFVASDAYWRINATGDGKVWLSTWGAGMLEGNASNDTIRFQAFNSFNSPLCGYPTNPNYTLPGDVTSDRSGNVWFAHYGSSTPNCTHHLFVREKNGSFTPFDYPGNPPDIREFLHITIDAFGTKWMASPGGKGLVYFNERNTIANTSDDIWGNLTSSDIALPSSDITAIVTDKNGTLWVGTPSNGLAVIFNPSIVLNNDPAKRRPSVRKLSLLASQSINDIVVDALNNKWIATNSGVWVLNEDGTEAIGYINKKDYPALLTDEVKCLAANENDGTVYLGTLQGLNMVKTLSLKPQEEFDVKVYPQPFNPYADEEVVIDGLEPETQIRIITLDGMLIRNINTKSRRVVWDGRDEKGNHVANGVYIVMGVSLANARSVAGKIAVVYK